MIESRKLRVLLLNPPGEYAYSRDKFCTSISQANYGWPPIDLLVFSGQMRDRFAVFLIDAIAENLSYGEALKRAAGASPDVIVSLTSAASWPEDFAFLRQLKVLTHARIAVGGDILLAKGEKVLQHFPFLDAVYLNYVTGDLLKWIDIGEARSTERIDNVIYREFVSPDAPIIIGEKHEGKSFTYGVPQHELFPIERYRFPFCRRSRYTSVITSFGCPWRCEFCVPGTFSLSLRPVEEVMEELRYLHRMGLREVLFQDSTLNANRDHSRKLFNALRESGLGMDWMCQSRADCVNDEILGEMRAAGCHTIQFGVESGDETVRAGISKQCRRESYEEAFARCRKHGIRPSGFFIIGLPGETDESVGRTIAFAKSLRCSTAVFGLAMPHPITALGQRAGVSSKDLGEEDYYDNFQHIGVQLSTLSGEQILAQRLKAYREFYMRPSYVLQRLTEIGSLYEFYDTCRNAFHLVKENFAARGLKSEKGDESKMPTDKPLHKITLRGRGKRVAIIGGGILGLSAAYRLATHGAEVHLFERDSFLGGLSAAVKGQDGSWIDRHHHFVSGTDQYLFNLTEELGCRDQIEWSETTLSYFTEGSLRRFTTFFDLLKFPGLTLMDKARFGLAVRWLQTQKDWRPLESISAAEWIEERCGQRVYDVLWRHLMECKFADASRDVPLSWLWARLTRRISTRKFGKGRECFGRLRGGMRSFISLLEDSIRAAGGFFYTSCQVSGINVDGNRVKKIVTDRGEIPCDTVIATLPNPWFLNLWDGFHDDYRKALDQIRYQGIVSIVVETSKRVTPSYWINIADFSIPVPGIIDMGHLDRGIPGSLLYLPHYVPCDSEYYRTDDSTLGRNALEWLQTMLPDFDPSLVESVHIFRDPYADPLYALNYSKSVPPHETPLENVLLYNTTQIYPITRSANNSIRFGLEAAERILEG